VKGMLNILSQECTLFALWQALVGVHPINNMRNIMFEMLFICIFYYVLLYPLSDGQPAIPNAPKIKIS